MLVVQFFPSSLFEVCLCVFYIITVLKYFRTDDMEWNTTEKKIERTEVNVLNLLFNINVFYTPALVFFCVSSYIDKQNRVWIEDVERRTKNNNIAIKKSFKWKLNHSCKEKFFSVSFFKLLVLHPPTTVLKGVLYPINERRTTIMLKNNNYYDDLTLW